MKNFWLYSMFAMLTALVASGCVHKGTAPSVRTTVRDYRIIQNTQHQGEQKVVSVITVLEDGRYQWQVRDWWANPVRDHSFSGLLPAPLLKQLQKENRSLETVDGVRVYQWQEGVAPESVPVGVRGVVEYLREAHLR